MLNVKNNTYLKIIIFFLICIFLFTLNSKQTKSTVGMFLVFGGSVEDQQECPAIYATVYWVSDPSPLPVMQTIDSRFRAYAWYGGFVEDGQYGLGTALSYPIPCVQSWYPYSQNGIGFVPILQGTGLPTGE